jgi:hypothetical protein
VECGHLIGFNREVFLEAMERAEEEADENGQGEPFDIQDFGL